MDPRTFIYRHRLLGKRAVAALSNVLPESAARRLRALAERMAFTLTPQYQEDTLPAIFHYWAERHVAPDAERLGIGSPETLYLRRVVEKASQCTSRVRILSVGTGAADMEIALARQLKTAGVQAHITCLDFNPTLMRRAAVAAEAAGVSALISLETRDCNQPFEMDPQDVIIVNQFFHHVTELETFCNSLRRTLALGGLLLTSDIVGRNGHQLWPDVETLVQEAWSKLPSVQRYDRNSGTHMARYRPIDHAAYSNEGVRAQDIVGCLLGEFDFELFFTFGGAIMPFIERRVGFNFNPDDSNDRAFIDEVQSADAAALAAAEYPAANMIAVLRHKDEVSESVYLPISPRQHVELARQQHAKLNC